MKKIIIYIGKILTAITLTPILMIFFNQVTNDSIIRFISYTQESALYLDYYSYVNKCESNLNIKKNSESAYLIKNIFSNDLGSCYVNGKLDKIKIFEIDINYGGRISSALVLSNEIKKRNINVKVIRECYSTCVDVLMHGAERLVCKGALVGIHQKSMNLENIFIKEYLIRNQKYTMNKYKEGFFDLDLIQKITNKTPSDKMYELSEEELLKTGIATKIIYCDKNKY